MGIISEAIPAGFAKTFLETFLKNSVEDFLKKSLAEIAKEIT